MGVGYQWMVIIFSLACIILETWLQQLLCSCQAGLQGNIVFVELVVVLVEGGPWKWELEEVPIGAGTFADMSHKKSYSNAHHKCIQDHSSNDYYLQLFSQSSIAMAILDNQELNVKANANAIEADMNASHCQDDFHQWFHVSPLQGSTHYYKHACIPQYHSCITPGKSSRVIVKTKYIVVEIIIINQIMLKIID